MRNLAVFGAHSLIGAAVYREKSAPRNAKNVDREGGQPLFQETGGTRIDANDLHPIRSGSYCGYILTLYDTVFARGATSIIAQTEQVVLVYAVHRVVWCTVVELALSPLVPRF